MEARGLGGSGGARRGGAIYIYISAHRQGGECCLVPPLEPRRGGERRGEDAKRVWQRARAVKERVELHQRQREEGEPALPTEAARHSPVHPRRRGGGCEPESDADGDLRVQLRRLCELQREHGRRRGGGEQERADECARHDACVARGWRGRGGVSEVSRKCLGTTPAWPGGGTGSVSEVSRKSPGKAWWSYWAMSVRWKRRSWTACGRGRGRREVWAGSSVPLPGDARRDSVRGVRCPH